MSSIMRICSPNSQPTNVRVINSWCIVRSQEATVWCSFAGIILAQFTHGDRMAKVAPHGQSGGARLTTKSRWREPSAAPYTVRRQVRRFEEGGLAALGRTDGYPQGRARLTAARQRLVQRLKGQGVGQREIARRIGVGENAIRKLLRRLGWKAAVPVQRSGPFQRRQLRIQTCPVLRRRPSCRHCQS